MRWASTTFPCRDVGLGWRGIPLNPPCPSLQGRTAPRAAPLAGTPCTFSPSAVCWSGTSLRGGGRAEGCLLQVQTTWNLQPLAQGHSRPRLGPCRAWLKSALAALAPILPSCVTIVYYYYYYLAVRRTNVRSTHAGLGKRLPAGVCLSPSEAFGTSACATRICEMINCMYVCMYVCMPAHRGVT